MEDKLYRERRLAQRRAHLLDRTVFDGVILPPKGLRTGGSNLRNDEVYLARAKEDADKLARHLGLTPESCLLDVGCGPGRLPIGILQSIGEIREYRGVDVDETSIRWAQHHITRGHPNFQFVHIDVENRRYNPAGSQADEDFTFPFADEEFDIITLYSVFTHMLAGGVRAYLKEFRRLLRPDGKIFLTVFLEEGVPDVTENPEGYLGRQWGGALHCVRYDRKFFERLLDENGFRLDGFDPTTRVKRGLFISKKTGSPVLLTGEGRVLRTPL